MECFNNCLNEATWVWIWCIYGVLLYNFLAFMFTKDGFDETRKKLNPKRYAQKRWDNWVWSILFIPITAFLAKEIFYYIMQIYEKEWEFNSAVYLGAGALSEFVYYLFKKGRSIINAIKTSKQ